MTSRRQILPRPTYPNPLMARFAAETSSAGSSTSTTRERLDGSEFSTPSGDRWWRACPSGDAWSSPGPSDRLGEPGTPPAWRCAGPPGTPRRRSVPVWRRSRSTLRLSPGRGRSPPAPRATAVAEAVGPSPGVGPRPTLSASSALRFSRPPRPGRPPAALPPTHEPSRTGREPPPTWDADPPDLLARLAVRIIDVALTV